MSLTPIWLLGLAIRFALALVRKRRPGVRTSESEIWRMVQIDANELYWVDFSSLYGICEVCSYAREVTMVERTQDGNYLRILDMRCSNPHCHTRTESEVSVRDVNKTYTVDEIYRGVASMYGTNGGANTLIEKMDENRQKEEGEYVQVRFSSSGKLYTYKCAGAYIGAYVVVPPSSNRVGPLALRVVALGRGEDVIRDGRRLRPALLIPKEISLGMDMLCGRGQEAPYEIS